MGKANKPTPSAASRFLRSVNLEHDLWRPNALDGYVVTAGVRRALMRVAPATTDAHASRVWTVTGPYGTGKSAFVLFLAWLFSHAVMGRAAVASGKRQGIGCEDSRRSRGDERSARNRVHA